jgi:hypothetical protein
MTSEKRLIGKVRETGYLGFTEWASSADAHLSCVHIASFHDPERGACEAFVKIFPGNVAKELANEVTSFLYAHALGVPQPDRAFIANIPLAHLRKPPGWVAQIKKVRATVPAFCTTRLPGTSAAVHVPNSEVSILLDDVAQWEYLERAVALDENIAQTDRHLNNLVRLSRNKFALIDGGRLANDDGALWTTATLDASKLYRNRLSERIWNHRPSSRSKDKILAAASTHASLVGPIRSELEYWWTSLLEGVELHAFRAFQLHRLATVEALLCRRYNLLI